MQALLIYNANAGGGAKNQAKLLQDELNSLASPTYRTTETEEACDG